MKNFSAFAVVLSMLGLIVVYPTVELFSSISDPHLMTFLVIFRLCLFFVVFHSVGYWFYRLLSGMTHSPVELNPAGEKNLPSVAVLIPVKDEPLQLVNRMFNSLKNIDYPCLRFVVIDNSVESQTELFNKIAKNLGIAVSVIRKNDSSGFKAGALNKALKVLDCNTKYILVLDIDHAPRPEILRKLVPELNADHSLAFIQAPQTYEESSCSIIEGAFCYRQRVFYDHICPGLSYNETLFFTGSNALFRKTALDEIGGFDESSLTEDLRTSFKLHQKKWTGRYYAKSVAVGLPPKDWHTYHRQQRRWAIGTYQNLFYILSLLFGKSLNLTLAQRMLYLGWNGTFYLQGFTGLILVLCSVIFLLFDTYRYLMWTDALVFPIFLITIFSTMLHERNVTNAKWRKLLIYKALLFGDSLVHISALSDCILSKGLVFEVTKKTGDGNLATVSQNFILYHVSLVLLLSLAVLSSFLTESISATTAFWPLVFLIQAITILAITRLEVGRSGI